MSQQEKQETKNLVIYSAIVGGSAILEFVRALICFYAAFRSSKMLHDR